MLFLVFLSSCGEGAMDDGTGTCPCDTTQLCEEGCACDVSCAVEAGEAPLGAELELFGRREIVRITRNATTRGPLDQLEVFDDGYEPSEAPELPATVSPPEPPFGSLGNPTPYPERGLSWQDRNASVTLPWSADTDGAEELLILDAGGVTLLDLSPSGEPVLTSLVGFAPERARWSMAAIEFDDTFEGPELAVVSELGGEAKLEIYAISATAGTLLAEVVVNDNVVVHDGVNDSDFAVAAIDLDGDGAQEIYVADATGAIRDRGVQLYRYGVAGGVLAPAEDMSVSSCSSDGDGRAVSMVAGPVTAEGLPLLAIVVNCGNGLSAVDVAVFGEPTRTIYVTSENDRGDGRGWLSRPAVALAQPEPSSGAGARLVLATTRRRLAVCRYSTSGDGGWLCPEINFTDSSTSLGPPSIATGDVDLDGADEVIVSVRDSREERMFAGEPFDPCLERCTGGLCDVECMPVRPLTDEPRSGPQFSVYQNTVALADLDGDSFRARATGEVVRWTGTPHINAVLAAPPTWNGTDGISQSGLTQFGVNDTTGASETRQITSSASVTASYSVGLFDVFSIEGSRTLSATYSRGSSQLSSKTTGLEVTTGASSNLVYYTLNHYASHLYEVVAHPDTALEGTMFSMDVPDRSVKVTQGLESFREQFGGAADELVPPALFVHRVGDPLSYRGEEACNVRQLVSAAVGEAEDVFLSQLVDVGNSDSGSSRLTVSFAEQTGIMRTKTLGVQLTGAVTIGGAGGSVTQGLEESVTHSTFVGQEVNYAGRVANLADPLYTTERRYLWGLCVYDFIAESGQAAFPVVDYVVAEPPGG